MTLQSVVSSLMGIGKGCGAGEAVDRETASVAAASREAEAAAASGTLSGAVPGAVPGAIPGAGGVRSTAERRAAGEFERTDAMPLGELIAALVEKSIASSQVSPERRRECLALMMEEGYSLLQAATALQVHVSTVKRDRVELRRAAAVEPTLTLGDEMLGEYFDQTMTVIQRMRKLASEEKTPAHVRLRVEEAMLKAYDRLLKAAMAMRYVERGDRRLRKLRELEEAEEIRRRVAAGASPMTEMLPPKYAAMMGYGVPAGTAGGGGSKRARDGA